MILSSQSISFTTQVPGIRNTTNKGSAYIDIGVSQLDTSMSS